MAQSEKRKRELTQDSIIAKALEMADAIGIESLSIRKLAKELDAGAMSIYYYFKSKEEILDKMIDEIYGMILLPSEDKDWKSAIRERCFSAREVLARHPWASSYMESRKNPGPKTLKHHNAVIGCFLRGGFSLEITSSALAITDAFVFGFAIQETTLPGGGGEEMVEMGADLTKNLFQQYPHLMEMTQFVMESDYRFGDIFESGLDILLEGLEKKK